MGNFWCVYTGYSHLRINAGAMDESTLQTSLLEEEKGADVKLKPMTAASKIVRSDKIETLRAEEL